MALCLSPVARAAQPDPNADYLLHLPGIAGYRWLDKQMIAGLRQGGYTARIAVYDWPGEQRGLGALLGRERNDAHAQKVAAALEKRFRENPDRRLVVTAHSGGTGIAVWALEKLPPDVKIDTLVMIAPALSPRYDLTDALRHVRGKAYAFTSTLDAVVLGVGTRTFGTIDGIKVEAAGLTGFFPPETAEAIEYNKLVPMPYHPAWMELGNLGDHIGPMRQPFARATLTPIVRGEDVPSTARPAGGELQVPDARAPLARPRRSGTTETAERREATGKKQVR